MPRLDSIAVRLIAAAALWVALMLVAGGLLLSNLFREPLEQAFEQRLNFLLESLIATVDLGPDGQAVERQPLGEPHFLRQYSGLYWQVGRLDTGTVLARSRSMWDFQIAMPNAADPALQSGLRRAEGASAAQAGYLLDGPLGQVLRVVERRVTDDDAPGQYLFLVAADRAGLMATIDEFNLTLLWSLGVLGAGLLLLVFLQVRFALLPLQRMRAALTAVREGRAQRLAGTFPDEIRPLAEELNGLLDHTAEVLARARAHVGNLAHALKTPLAVLGNEGDRPGPDTPAVLRQQTALIRRHVDHHLARARAIGQAPLLRGQVRLLPVFHAVARALERLHDGYGLRITVAADPALAFRGEQNDLEEMLGNLLDNACKWARHNVSLRAEALAAAGAGGLQVRIVVDDDGPGIPAERREDMFERGRRLDESKPGSGLGLSIVRDIATLYGGRVELGEVPDGGLRAVLVLPGARMEAADG